MTDFWGDVLHYSVIMKTTIFLSMLFTLLLGKYDISIAQTAGKYAYNPIVPDNIADPSIVIFNGTYYLYATTDLNKGLGKAGAPVVWKSKDFVNWNFEGTLINDIDFNKPYNYTDAKGVAKTGYFRYWAPGKPLYKNGKYYLYATIVKPDDKNAGYAFVADKPEGPFKFANGKGVFFNEPDKVKDESIPIAPDIDGEPFVDDNGDAYLFWRRRNAAKLSSDLLSLEGPTISIPTKHDGYSEGPLMFKRKGIYYYIYTLSGSPNYCNAYMMSTVNPLGPFTAPPTGPDVFVHSDIETGVWGPGHGNVLHLPGTDDYYFIYLEYGEGGTSRQVYANKMQFNADGTIAPMKIDLNGVGYLGKNQQKETNLALNAVATASSHKADRISNARIEPDPNSIQNIGGSFNGPNVQSVSRTFSYDAKNATDNLNGTRWMADATDAKPWYMLDLGKKTKIKNCDIFFYLPTLAHTWILEKSNDQQTWEVVKKQDETTVVRSPEMISKIGDARYLRLTITNGPAGIWEMKVY